MSFKAAFRSRLAQFFLSDGRRSFLRHLRESRRLIDRRGHEVIYFHRADDPYCQLMVQILPELAARFDIQISPKVVEKLPANMYPDPQRYEAYCILDTVRLARLYGLGFPREAVVPDPLSVGMINRHLITLEGSRDFFATAEELGEALWRRELGTIQRECKVAQVEDDRLRDNEKTLARLGHYASASLYYEGEFYPGIDRLDHLERRLNALGAGDGDVHYALGKCWPQELQQAPFDATGQRVELFFSVRSPYSALALEQVAQLQEKTGVRVSLRPVLPMVVRGMPLPKRKLRYIPLDAKREAGLYGIDFGHMSDPLGEGVFRTLAIGCALGQADSGGTDLAIFRAAMRAIWADGQALAEPAQLQKVTDSLGINWSDALAWQSDDSWRQQMEQNRVDMQALGCRGVPSFKVGSKIVWGQDRLWWVVEALRAGAGAG